MNTKREREKKTAFSKYHQGMSKQSNSFDLAAPEHVKSSRSYFTRYHVCVCACVRLNKHHTMVNERSKPNAQFYLRYSFIRYLAY